ncbi:MAG: sulfatase [Gemmatales bacterium]|nr:sulfatase [Gemmatales bacterium]MDW7994626.1 sulfatase [Gemmatales bacterium]
MASRSSILLLAALFLFIMTSETSQANERPNFVIFLTDDQRADAMSCAGNTILQTPNMDRLAREGMRFLNMFVINSLCAPSRATLLTGLYSHVHGVIDNKKRNIPAEIPIVSDYLRQAGYEVAFCGKSHMAEALRDRTWDYYFGYRGQGDYLNPRIAESPKLKDIEYSGYVDDIVTDRAVNWLQGKRQKPFCLFLWFKAPHRPWTRAPRHGHLFRDITIPKPPTYDLRTLGSPGKPKAFHLADNKIGSFPDVKSLDQLVKDYYATLVAVDENVGKVLDVLQETGQLNKTAIFLTSDNGFFLGEWQAFDKRFMHEPSIRVPLLVRYPPLVREGTTCAKMVLNLDIAPTIMELAGLPVPAHMQGRSLVPLLRGLQPENWRTDWLYEYYEYPGPHKVRKHRGIRTERYKLIHYYEDPEEFELYDLQNDPEERNNLYAQPGTENLVISLRRRMEELRRETRDPEIK